MVPKLVAEDIPLLQSLLSDVFPGVKYIGAEMKKLKAEIKKVCTEMNLVYGEGEEQGSAWVDKVRFYCSCCCVKESIFFSKCPLVRAKL